MPIAERGCAWMRVGTTCARVGLRERRPYVCLDEQAEIGECCVRGCLCFCHGTGENDHGLSTGLVTGKGVQLVCHPKETGKSERWNKNN